MMNRLYVSGQAFRTGAGCVAVWLVAAAAIVAYMGVNLLFSEAGEHLTGSCASIPVILFFVAAVRNGLRFTLAWAGGLLLLAFVSFLAYGMDAGLLSFLLAGVAAVAWMGVLIFWALAYRPSEGAMGAMLQGASGAMARARGAMGKGGAPGVSLMTVLLVCNLFVSLMGVLV